MWLLLEFIQVDVLSGIFLSEKLKGLYHVAKLVRSKDLSDRCLPFWSDSNRLWALDNLLHWIIHAVEVNEGASVNEPHFFIAIVVFSPLFIIHARFTWLQVAFLAVI